MPSLERFSTIELFRNAPTQLLDRVISSCPRATARKFETFDPSLWRDPAATLVLSGRVWVSFMGRQSRAAGWSSFHSNDVFGLSFALAGLSPGFTVEARDTTSLLILPSDVVLELAASHPAAIFGDTGCLAREIGPLVTSHVDVCTLGVRDRLLHYLDRLCDRGVAAEGAIIVEYVPNQSMIASAIGTHREAVSRIMVNLREEGVIDYDAEALRVFRRERLRATAGDDPGIDPQAN